jgi:Porin subfamily
MKSFFLRLSVMALFPTLASAAELPSRKPQPAPAMRKCEIGGMSGYMAPGSDVCVKISGFISAQVTVGPHTKP